MTKVLSVRSLLADNGPGTQPLTLAARMRERGIQTIFATGGGANVSNIREQGFTLYEISELAPDRHDAISILRAVRHLGTVIRKVRPDVIHGHNAAATLCAYAAGLCVGRRIPCVTSVRGVEERAAYQWRNRIWARLPGLLLGVCEKTRQRLLSFGVPDEKIRVTYNGVDVARFNPSSFDGPAEKRELGLTGRVVVGQIGAMIGPDTLEGPSKGQHHLITAAHLLRGDCPDLSVLLVGDGPWRHSLEEHAASLGMTDHVIFAGRRFDAPRLLSAMDIYAQPSIFGEFFPNAILEAMSMHLPWIGSDLAGLSELTAHDRAGWVSPPGDVMALTENLRLLSTNPDLRFRRGKAGREEVERRFTIDHVVARVLDAYNASAA